MYTAGEILSIGSSDLFNESALKLFRYQARNNAVYGQFLELLKVNPAEIVCFEDIPHLPVSFFKTHRVVTGDGPFEAHFTSSGTSGLNTSSHFVKDLALYRTLSEKGFEHFYGPLAGYIILALLPGYLERKESSLVYMVNHFISKYQYSDSGFYLHNLDELSLKLETLDRKKDKKILLLGVTYALLDLSEKKNFSLKNTIIMETGGMKGKREELTRFELHKKLKNSFGVKEIHSEYGMTELLSQAWSKGNGIFQCPPWMKISIRDTADPFTLFPPGKTGAINVCDLANVHSCSFIALDDLGKLYDDGSFEVTGRMDNSDLRGCNLLVE
ncbi:MAG: acyl transferase [Bacteroidota bacterium]